MSIVDVNQAPILDLDGQPSVSGFRLNGVTASDQSGIAVSSAGDVNGDGLDDLLIGAPYNDPNARSKSRHSYVVFGASTGCGSSLNLSSLNGSNGFRLNGISANDLSGRAVSSA
ncbi:MAG: integrin alpha [Synechocystis sp.]